MLSARKHHFIVEFYDTYAFSFLFVSQDSGVSWTLSLSSLVVCSIVVGTWNDFLC